MGNRAKKLIMLCVLLVGCAVMGFVTYSGGNQGENKVDGLIAASKAENHEKSTKTIKIYVSGAVMTPGIYDISVGARAYEAVTAAGGMTEQADADRVNLAKKLKDGDHVNVPAVKNSAGRGKSSGSTSGKTSSTHNGNTAVNNTSTQQGGTININTASQKELEALPGIGPAMAGRIIAEREKQAFKSVDDLLRVKGIGPAKLSKLRNFVSVN